MSTQSKIIYLSFIVLTFLSGLSFGAHNTYVPWWQQEYFINAPEARVIKVNRLLHDLERDIRTPNQRYPHFYYLTPQHRNDVLFFFGVPEGTYCDEDTLNGQRALLAEFLHPTRCTNQEIFGRVDQLYNEIFNPQNRYAPRNPDQAANPEYTAYQDNRPLFERIPPRVQQAMIIGGIATSLYSLYKVQWAIKDFNVFCHEFSPQRSWDRLHRINHASRQTEWIYKQSTIRPLVNFTPHEKQIILNELSYSAWFSPDWIRKATGHSIEARKRFSLYPRYLKAVVGDNIRIKRKWAGPFLTQETFKLDSIRHACKKLSRSLFTRVQSMIHDTFMKKVEAEGRNRSLSDDKYLTHKVKAATICAATTREIFMLRDIKEKRATCANQNERDRIALELLDELRTKLTHRLCLLINP